MGAELPDYQSYFNSRPHGGRQARPIFFDASRDFNSRPHGGRQHPSADGQSDRNFNSRPHGGRHHRSGHDYDRVEFQLTPSRRATREYIAVSTFATYFNSRPHGGRQLDLFGRLKSGNFNSRPHGGRHVTEPVQQEI